MQIVTDSGFDLTQAERDALDIHIVPHTITLQDKSYLNGVDITPSRLYQLLEETGDFPTTSQPAAGDFLKVYQKVTEKDPDILSIHMSAGLSGTMNSVKAAVKQVEQQGINANITVFDTRTLSFAYGWIVQSACLARDAGWDAPKIVEYMKKLTASINSIYTLSDLKYLIHGGRISHIRGLLANALNIKPMIGVDRPDGKYEQLGRARTFKRALTGLVDIVKKHHPEGSELVIQTGHADNLEAAQELRNKLDKIYKCHWRPIGRLSPVLGAHTGPSMVGIAFAPKSVFEFDLPTAH